MTENMDDIPIIRITGYKNGKQEEIICTDELPYYAKLLIALLLMMGVIIFVLIILCIGVASFLFKLPIMVYKWIKRRALWLWMK